MPLSAASTSKRRVRLQIGGIVQGVGFRPLVYQLAARFSLSGWVLNGPQGVTIEIEGESAKIKSFITSLKNAPPPLSRIDTLDQEEVALQESSDFIIRHSDAGTATAMISADIAMCPACEAEFHDPENRRYRYFFINCTDCGPRYTIIEALPYDRAATSMRIFPMCPECEAEYRNPLNRRYHAQPVSCFKCGPKLYTLNLQGERSATDEAAVDEIVSRIRAGETVAIKGMGGFHLVCDATNETAVAHLRKQKKRPAKPLAVMCASIEAIKEIAVVDEKEKTLLLGKERPIVILTKKTSTLLAPSIAPNLDRLGLFIPYTPLHLLLLEKLNRPIVATSANISEAPIITDEQLLLKNLSQVVSAVLSFDREIVNACDDSVVMRAGDHTLSLRTARGFAPKSLPLPFKTKRKILAVGAQQKNSLALAFDDHLILSPHIGDLNSLEAFEYFERTLDSFRRFYAFEPDLIVCDRHPEYETTKWAKMYQKTHPQVRLIETQHHYAHALACMAEYGLDEQVLAFCFDGTGYGDESDQPTLWGGEVLVADPLDYTRLLHLKPFPLLGGEKAVKEPRRVALALLFECFSWEELPSLQTPTLESFTLQELKILHTMWKNGTNTPHTSSIGRLFDAIASLSGIKQKLDYEGEGGILIETAAENEHALSYPFEITDKEIDYRPMIRAIIKSQNPIEIASRFMQTVIEMILTIARKHKALPILLSGGVFQNRLLVRRLEHAFKKEGFRYYIQQSTPVNDGGIALGQLYGALHSTRREDG